METEDEYFCNNCKKHVSPVNFAIHSAYCERNIFVCKVCDEPVQISEKDQHVKEYHVISPCDLCEAPIQKWMLPKHMELCPKRILECEYCEAGFPLAKYHDHVEFCGSRTEKCLLCQKYIMTKDKSKHSELHMYKKQLLIKSIEDEINQNKVNEVIIKQSTTKKKSETASSTSLKVSEGGDACLLDTSKSKICKEGQNSEIPPHEAAVASLSEKEFSKHYTQCHICKQTIPWIDFNTHVPNCASSAGKCSLCGEDVPSYEMKEHMKKHSQGRLESKSFKVPQNQKSPYETTHKSNQSDVAESEICDAVLNCPYCSQAYSEDQILEHTRNCPKNLYKCSLCYEKIPEKDKHKHETSECRMLQDNDEFNRSYFSRNSQSVFECPLCSKQVPEEDRENHMSFQCEKLLHIEKTHGFYAVGDDSYECPYCAQKMPQNERDKHQSFFCEVLIENSGVNIKDSESYAEVTKKTCCGNCKLEICPTCKNKFPKGKISEHKNSCSRLKLPCQFCNEMIEPACEAIHLEYCPFMIDNRKHAVLKTSVSQSSGLSAYKQKGAIPKNTSIQDMMKPRSAKCKYCNTAYNVEILPNHEGECIHMPVQCKDCFSEILLKDLNSHKCRRKRGKGKNYKMAQQTSEGKEEHSFWHKAKKMLSFTDGIETVKKEPSMQPTYCCDSPKYVPGDVRHNEKLYFERADDTLLPCEFCQKEFPASELVLHETGCQPHLVSYAKPNLPEKSESDKSGSRQDCVRKDSEPVSKSQNFHAAGARRTFFSKSNSILSSGASEHSEHNRESNDKAGEYLKLLYNESSSIYPEYPKKKEGNGEEKNEALNFQSVWNARNPSDLSPDHYHLKKIGISDVGKTGETTNLNKEQKEKIKESDHKASQKHPHSDNEIRDMLKFLKENEDSESDEEFVSLSDENGEPENSEMKVCYPLSTKHNMQEKQEDPPVSKKIVGDKECKEVCQETLKSSGGNIEKDQEECSRHLADFKFGGRKTATFSSEDNVHDLIHSKEKYELKDIKFLRNIERSSNQKDVTSFRDMIDLKLDRYNSAAITDDNVNSLKRFANFKLGRDESSLSFEEKAYCPKNYDTPKNLYEQKIPKNSDSRNDVKENTGHFKHVTDFKYGAYVSTVLSDEEIQQLTVLPEKHNEEPEELYNKRNSRGIGSDVNNVDYIRNFRQHLPDFKYGNLDTGNSSENNMSNVILPESRNNHGKQAFMLEPADSLMESKIPLRTVVKKEQKEVGLEEKIAALQKNNKKLLSSATNNENDVRKWNEWRMKPSEFPESD